MSAIGYIAISGTVRNAATGETLPGATVAYFRSSTGIVAAEALVGGTTTDLDGRFSDFAPSGSYLKVSFMGYTAQTLQPGQNLDIRLQAAAYGHDEVVVTGKRPKKTDWWLVGGITAAVLAFSGFLYFIFTRK